MPLFTKNNKTTLFIHIPKTAGTAIETAFMDAGYERKFLHMPNKGDGPDKKPCNPQHWHHGLVQRWIYPEHAVHSEFAIVRHPFTRCISEMMWKHGGKDKFDKAFFSNFEQFVVNNLRQYFKNEEAYQSNKSPWLNGEKTFHSDNHWRPQWHFVNENTTVYKYEELDSCWQKLKQNYNLTQLPVVYAKLDLQKERPVRMGIDPSTEFKDLYLKAYKEDHDRFGYELPFV